MSHDEPRFEDEALRSALKRLSISAGASRETKARVASLLIAGTPAVLPGTNKAPRPTTSAPRVFGLPRNVGLAAALALLLVGGGLTFIQLREMFPTRPAVVVFDRVKAMIDSLVALHGRTPAAGSISTDLLAFQHQLPSSMPLATLSDAKAEFVTASVDELDGQICYSLRYTVDGKPFTLVTGAPRMYYEIPKYNQIEGNIRLIGGERSGYLVCLMGDSNVAEPIYQTMFAGVKMLSSPSTQPVGSVIVSGTCTASN